MMLSLLQFFETLTGISLNINNPLVLAIVCIFGFIIVYDFIHILFGGVFDFIHK